MVLGFPRLEDYLHHSRSHGAIVGRVANRTAGASLHPRRPDLRSSPPTRARNHLHGGADRPRQPHLGDGDRHAPPSTVYLFYHSPDGEEGYPGTVDFAVTFRLEGPRLICEMAGTPDRPTPISLANHSYYNLGGGGTVKDHLLWVDAPRLHADRRRPDPDRRDPPGRGHASFDFSTEREIGDTGLDLNLVLDPGPRPQAPRPPAPAARAPAGSSSSGPTSRASSSSTPPSMTIAAPGHDGQSYGPYAGFCLEAQHFPDSLHHPDWPSIVCTPESPYFQRLVVEIARS